MRSASRTNASGRNLNRYVTAEFWIAGRVNLTIPSAPIADTIS